MDPHAAAPARRAARAAAWGVGAGALVGAGTLAYAAGWEVRAFVLRHAEAAVLPPGHTPLRVLHLSDLHLTPRQQRKRAWVAGLAALEPDLVVGTGDFLAHPNAVGPVLEALDGLLDVPGVFVFGSNDYFAPSGRNPAKYLLPDDGTRYTGTARLPWPDLRDGFLARGWRDLTNRFDTLTVRGTTVAFAGVDDPHLGYDDLAAVAGPADPTADLRVGVAHAPYLRVLDQYADDGYDLVFAGHTHGGQLCLPWKGALVTNCDLDAARAKGLHRHPADSAPGDAGSSWLHVSAGLGTSPYVPLRFCCRPEATLLTLLPQA
ncbi:MAG: metallophosphoesterase [Nocardioides sp.]|nr:metallophosphoesterase [Nocardioides sp.]